MSKMLTSRTAALTYQTCKRKRFLTFHAKGSGVVSGFLSLDLAIGTCYHRGIQHLLEHCRVEHPDGGFEEQCVDMAVSLAVDLWMNDFCSNYPIKPKGAETTDFVIYETASLIEGMIRAFSIFRLPGLLDKYEILEVEKEEVFELSDEITFLAKADGLMRNKVNNELVVLSLKTASALYPITLSQILYDMQGKSEIAVVQDRLQKALELINENREELLETPLAESYLLKEANINADIMQYLLDLESEKIIVKFVQYEFIVKGAYKEDSDGYYKRNSYLVHPSKQDSFMMMGASGFNRGSDNFKWKVKPGRQPKGWQKINIWEDIGIKEWVDLLARGMIQPEEGIPFMGMFSDPDEYLVMRSESEIEEWKISTAFQEETIKGYLEQLEDTIVKSSSIKESETLLMQYFPKETQSCTNYYGGDCPFISTCHNGITLDSLIENGAFTTREPHHELEEKEFKEKGLK